MHREVAAKALDGCTLPRNDGRHAIVEQGQGPGGWRPDGHRLRRPLLLVVSHQGRGVVDLASGELIARDRQEPGAWFDAARRAARGIGPLDGTWVSVCGLAGGQLPDATADGWQVRVSGNCVTISAPGREPVQVRETEEIRALGFSPDGTTLVIATSPGLAIYRRAPHGSDLPPAEPAPRREL